jgi:hypothetical protein
MNKEKLYGLSKSFKLISIIASIVSFWFFRMGWYKMTVYRNSESSFVDNKNAYVGGDAYNYIINGTYSTSYFVLAIGSLLLAAVCTLIYVHIDSQCEILKQNERIVQLLEKQQTNAVGENTNNSSFNELPKI